MSCRKDKYSFDYYNKFTQNIQNNEQQTWYDTLLGIILISILTNIAGQWFWHKSVERPTHKKEYDFIKKELKEIKENQKHNA